MLLDVRRVVFYVRCVSLGRRRRPRDGIYVIISLIFFDGALRELPLRFGVQNCGSVSAFCYYLPLFGDVLPEIRAGCCLSSTKKLLRFVRLFLSSTLFFVDNNAEKYPEILLAFDLVNFFFCLVCPFG